MSTTINANQLNNNKQNKGDKNAGKSIYKNTFDVINNQNAYDYEDNEYNSAGGGGGQEGGSKSASAQKDKMNSDIIRNDKTDK